MNPALEWSHWPSPAKLNLFLHITGRRADGYHILQTVFQLLDWGDEVRLRLRPDDQRIERLRGAQGVPAQDDLSVRAAQALRQAAGRAVPGVDIAVQKRIPQGGGFGGGSSNAATVLLVLNRLWGLNLDQDALAQIGLKLGADVPVFVRGHSAFAEGVGERLQALSLPRRWFLLVDSGLSVPTAELFQAPDLTRGAPSVTIADFASGFVHGNAFEPVLRRRSPQMAAALDQLSAFGTAQVTGTGGGVFVAFESRDAAQAALQALPSTWRAWVAEGVNRSPLHRRLQGDADSAPAPA